MRKRPANSNGKQHQAYWVLAVSLVALFFVVRGGQWGVGPEFGVALDAVSLGLALAAGTVALIRNGHWPEDRFLYAGIGLLFVGFLDAYHLVADLWAIAGSDGGQIGEVLSGGTHAPFLVLSVTILLIGLMAPRDSGSTVASSRPVLPFIITLIVLAVVVLVTEDWSILSRPLPGYLYFDRPDQLLVPVVLALALAVFLREGLWKKQGFEFWLVLGLIAALFGRFLFLPVSGQGLDAPGFVAALLDVLLYVFCFTGLVLELTGSLKTLDAVGETPGSQDAWRFDDLRQTAPDSYFRQMFESTGTGLAVINSRGQFVLVNQTLLDITGAQREDIPTVPFIEMIAESDRQRIEGYNRARVRGEAVPESYELRFLTMRGEERTGIVTVTGLPGTNDFAVSLSDVTEHKRQEAELAKLSLAVDQVPVSVVITDLNANIEYVNNAFEEITGYSREEVLGKNPRILQSGETPEASYRELWTRLRNGQSWTGEFINRRKNGDLLVEVVTIAPVRQVDGVATHYVAVKEDITGQRQLQRELENYRDLLEERVEQRTQELAEAERKYRTVADFTYDWEVWAGRDGKWLYCSPACERVSGFTARDFLENPRLFFERIHPDDVDKMRHASHHETDDHSIHDVRFRFYRKDGELRWLRHVCQQVFDEEGNPQGRRASNRDITNRVNAQEELLRSRDEAREAARAKTQFLATMSHEMRTPLNAILGMTHLVLDGCRDEEQCKKLKKVQDSGEHLLKLVSDVLELSKLESGKSELELERFDICELLGKVSAMVEDSAQSKGLDLRIDCPEGPCAVEGDVIKITQVLLNLSSNAIKFTESGAVSIGARRTKGTDTSVEVLFEVSDEGVGIPAADQERLFELFNQLDNSMTRRHGGSGLGLALSQRFVRAMGGRIEVESEPGRGSRFFFSLALARAKDSSDPESREIPTEELKSEIQAQFSGRRVLVVEDDLINREVARGLLSSVNIEVVTAEDGAQALERLGEGSFDLVLMDVQMPVMDGIECVRAIRRDPSLEGLAVIALTANAFREDREKCLEAGMDDFVSKPVDAAHFYSTVLTWLRRSAM